MMKIEDDCVGCGLPCIDSCSYKNVPHYYCDKCDEEDVLYEYDGYELCSNCLLKEFDIVEGSQY